MNKTSPAAVSAKADKGHFLHSFRFVLTLLFGALTIYVLALANYSIISSDSYYTTITVSGHGEIETKPDITKLSINISANVSSSTSKVASSSEDYILKIVNYLKSKGVVESDIKITNAKSVNVKLRGSNMENAKSIATSLEKIAEKNISVSISDPQVENLDILKSRALDLALNNAKMNALKVSSSLGVNLGKVTSYYDNDQNPNGYSDEKNSNDSGAGTLSTDITVSYQIR